MGFVNLEVVITNMRVGPASSLFFLVTIHVVSCHILPHLTRFCFQRKMGNFGEKDEIETVQVGV